MNHLLIKLTIRSTKNPVLLREERQSGSSNPKQFDCKETIIRNHFEALRGKKSKLFSAIVYGGISVLVFSFFVFSSHSDNPTGGQSQTSGSLASVDVADSSRRVSSVDKVSVDELSAASAATDLAEIVQLPSAGDLRESTASLNIKKELSQNSTDIVVKPDILKPEESSNRGITSYVTKSGDSIDSIAKRYKISAQTLRWANNTTSDAVEAGKTLIVPLTDGIVYTVKAGDTPQSLAEKYKSNAERITLYNDIEESKGLVVGSRIVLPNGELPEDERPGYVKPRQRTYSVNNYSSWSYGNASGEVLGRRYGFNGPTVGNRYAPGNCTWYAYERRAQLGRSINTGYTWGNAYSWAASARAAGFVVNNTPAPGAIFQTSSGGGGYGHVGIVERVEGGTVYISDMNYAGYNVVTQRILSNPGAYNYIH